MNIIIDKWWIMIDKWSNIIDEYVINIINDDNIDKWIEYEWINRYWW